MARFIFIILFVIRTTSAMSETKIAIRPSELNQKILEDIHRNYSGYLIAEAFKVNNRGVIMYEAIIQDNKGRLNLYYNSNGAFIKKEQPAQKKIMPKKPISKR